MKGDSHLSNTGKLFYMLNNMESKYIKLLTCTVVVLYLVTLSKGAVTPAHTHTHHHPKDPHQHTKEREEDGAFSARDHSHYAQDEHHAEFDHESVLGSTKEAEEFDSLPPEEAKRRLRILLEKMDLNADGEIEKNELHAWLLRSFQMLSKEESEERMDEADENEDGFVTWDEYIAETYGIHDDDDAEVLSAEDREDEDELMAEDRIMFTAADKNKDGRLDNEEFLAFSHPEEHPDMLQLILKNTINEKDKNKDGFLDFQEFVAEKAKTHDKEWLVSEKEKFDSELDKDRDGRLDPQEVLSWLVPSNDEIADDEVEHLFVSSDDDQNGILSFDEVLEHHDVFVGSEVTDYGDHLHNIHVFQDEL